MKLTKDEARILAAALEDAKFILYDKVRPNEKEPLANAMESLQARLTEAGNDQRRVGRTSQDDFTDMLRRYILKST